MRTPPRRSVGPALPGLVISALLVVGAIVASSDGGGPGRLFGGEPRSEGSHAFLRLQASGDPVGYNPCQSVEIVVNPQGAPDNWQELVDTGIRHVNEASGLRLRYAGRTTDRNFDRSGYSVYGEQPPVLVGWATGEEVPALAGNAGVGGSSSATFGADTRYLTGKIVLDIETFQWVDEEQAQAIVDHELGHVVGLAHVDDPGELMAGDGDGVTAWGPGDLEGLAALGSIPC